MINPAQIILFQGSNPDISGLVCIVNRNESYVFTISRELAEQISEWTNKGGYGECTITTLDGTEVLLSHSVTRRLWWNSVELHPMRDRKRLGSSGRESNPTDLLAQIKAYHGATQQYGTVRVDLDD